ncbi:hypothetical protein PHMEG_00031599 [Phytophthora megakarya]|uniref:Uncharacterized protein n=1 Tax=Phytophthora megakarya TaxID=4795 RepID=A0A225UWE8_9STRA|nr:hypothetical protein PHMEG_00031599 [Phytophthora megakarya]
MEQRNQETYMRLSTFVESRHRRWRRLKPSDKGPQRSFKFLAFLYVCNVTSLATSADFHRATEKRVQQARLQRMAHEAANEVSVGPITAHHLDIVNARRPDAAAFHPRPENWIANETNYSSSVPQLSKQHAQGPQRFGYSGLECGFQLNLISFPYVEQLGYQITTCSRQEYTTTSRHMSYLNQISRMKNTKKKKTKKK